MQVVRVYTQASMMLSEELYRDYICMIRVIASSNSSL